MIRTTAIIGLLALLLPTTALADQLSRLTQRKTLLRAHRARLEKLLTGQVARIGRLKAQPSGVRRDFQLRTALRDNLQLASKLTALQGQAKALNRRLVKAYDRALAATTDKVLRTRLIQRRAELSEQLAGRKVTRIVTRGRAELLDDPEDLEEKADLLKDSESKLRRQLRRVKKQISRLRLRSKLRRHGRGIDDRLFVEDAPRRTARARKSTETRSAPTEAGVARAPKAGEADKDSFLSGGAGPAPAAPPTGKRNDTAPAPKAGYDPSAPGGATGAAPQRGSSNSAGGGSDLSLSVRGVLDPSIVRELRKASKSGNLKQRLAALKRAQQRLQQLANRLGLRAKDLRTRARRRRAGK